MSEETITLIAAAKLLGIPQLAVLQMTQGPNPILRTIPNIGAGHRTGPMLLALDDVLEVKAWMNSCL